MPTQKWVCDICGAEYSTQKSAEECEDHGRPPFKFKAGQKLINRINKPAGTIISARYRKGTHEPFYIIRNAVSRRKNQVLQRSFEERGWTLASTEE